MKLNKTFKTIEGAKNYMAGILGEIYNVKYNRILRDCSNGWAGYRQLQVTLNNGSRKSKTVHKLVWEAFNGAVPKGFEISHIDDTKDNNCLSNLCLMTRKENLNHGDCQKRKTIARKNGTSLRREYDMKKLNSVSEATKEKHRQMSLSYWQNRREIA